MDPESILVNARELLFASVTVYLAYSAEMNQQLNWLNLSITLT